LNEIDLIKVTWYFWSKSIESVNDVRNQMILLCFAQHKTVDTSVILDAHEDDTSGLVIDHTIGHW
jgi:hypothetical protein